MSNVAGYQNIPSPMVIRRPRSEVRTHLQLLFGTLAFAARRDGTRHANHKIPHHGNYTKSVLKQILKNAGKLQLGTFCAPRRNCISSSPSAKSTRPHGPL